MEEIELFIRAQNDSSCILLLRFVKIVPGFATVVESWQMILLFSVSNSVCFVHRVVTKETQRFLGARLVVCCNQLQREVSGVICSFK